MLDGLHTNHRLKGPIVEGQPAHVGDVSLTRLPHKRGRINVNPDGLAWRELVDGMADAAAEVEYPPWRKQRGT
jgi:hypothetical protein